MIVQCPSCASRYRVNAANIPATGGKIRCPSCSHAFAVYPESAPEPEAFLDAENKTSIAERPNLQELLSQMRQGSAGAAGGLDVDDETDDAQTEVMEGGNLPDFAALFGGNAPETDSTVEMANPLLQAQRSVVDPASPAFQDDINTQELNADIVAASLGQVRAQAQSKPPIQEFPGMRPSGQAPPLPLVGQPPTSGQQRRLSAPNGPTPPPSMPPSAPPPTPMPGSPGLGVPSSPPPQPGISPPGAPQSSPMDFGSTPSLSGDASATDATHEGPWKLQTNFGLTYEFADNKSLRNWLESRDDLDGFKLSADGTNFLPLSEFPQFQKPQPRSATMANRSISSSGAMAPLPGAEQDAAFGSGPRRTTSGVGLGSAPVPGISDGTGPPRSPFTTAQPAVAGPGPVREKINPDEIYRPPSRDGGVLNKVLWITFGLLVIAALAVGVFLLDGMGVIDIFEKEPPPTQPSQQITSPAPPPVLEEDLDETDGEALRQRQEQQLQRMLEDAQEDLDSNRLTSAQDRLDNALLLEPERPEIYEMKAEIHEKLGESDLAREMREKAEQLRDEEAENPASEPSAE